MDAYTVIGVVADKDAAPDTSLNSMFRCQVDEMKNEFSSEMLKSSPSLNSVPVGESSSASARTPLRVDLKSSELKIMSGSSSVRTNDSMLSDLTINKFNIQSMGLIGREREIDILKSCYHRMMEEEKGKSVPVDKSISTQSLVQSNLHKELVFVSGYSGVGKSSLAKTLKNEIVGRTAEGIYAEGKFDSNASDEPYSGISSAFGQICKRILERQDQSRKNAYPGDDSLSFGSRLLAVLGPSTNLLSNLIPELQDVLPVMRRNSDNSGSEQCDFDMLQERVKYAFRVLMRTLNAELSPIVLVLDDLQWADSSSLEVVDFLISDLQNPKALMIVVCYRSNEVDEHSQLFKMIQTLQVKQEKFNFHITDVTVGSCDIDSVNKIIMAMMSIDDEERTLGLAEVCFKRTAGNPFFLIEFMVMLHEEKLILYNLGLLKWIWDEERIAEETMSTDNVVDLLQARMRKMPANVQLLLQYAACLGSSFSASTLDLIWRKQSVMSADFAANTITDLLAVVISSNFVEACGENEYHWVHDKVQEAALLLNDIVTPAFQFEIGTALLHSLDANGLEEHLFDVVDLINKGRVSKRHEFAKLNLRAAEKAKKISAFRSAAKYAANGIELLPSDKWTIHRSLTLALYTIGSEVELALGRYETEEIYSDKVLNRKECTLMEALPLKMAKSLKLCHVDMKFKESIEINLGLLKDLGVKLLWSRATTPMQSVTTLMHTIKMAKKAFGPEDIVEKLGHMEDAKHRAAMLILSRVCYASFRTGDFFLNILCGCKRVEMTLKYGVCDDSPVAFSALGQVAVIAKQDYGAAAFFAELALALQKACRPSRQSESLLIAHGFCVPWSRPLQQCSAPFADGYASGMRTGDTVNAMWCLLAHQAWLPYTMGKRLGPMLDQCPKILSQMEELSQPEQATALKIFWQTLLNLVTTPVSKDAQKLEGAIFSAEGFTGAHAVSVGIMHRWQGELLVYYDLEAAAKTALNDGDKFSKLSPGTFQNMRGTFNRAIALFAMAQRTRKRVYRNLANKLASQIKGWVRGGNPNVRHYHLALMAEQAALSKKYVQAEENYKNAIALAARTGHMHDTALINERYAEFLHEELSDEQESKYRIGEAIRFYKEWGAFGKAEALQQQWLWLKVVC